MTETIVREPKDQWKGSTWWGRYSAALARSGLTESARRVIDLDAQTIVKEGIFGVGGLDSGKWPSMRVRTGLVVGSVQSGKTASMLAVTAKALDRGVDVVVILSGTRTALWRQTAQRTLEQLDGWTPDLDSVRRLERLIIPSPSELVGRGKAPSLSDLYFEPPSRLRRFIQKRRPVVAIVMKNGDHLIEIGRRLREGLSAFLNGPDQGRPLHILVIDDEADDGSILDAVVEAGMAPDSDKFKQIPRHIARIWAGPGDSKTTFQDNVFATYIAYTATPQANVLQASHNPLSPRDFVLSLRTPFDNGPIDPPRQKTFTEPLGVSRFYTGGEIFYNRSLLVKADLCVSLEYPARKDYETDIDFETAVDSHKLGALGDALRAYFVAGAMRLLEDGRRLSNLEDLRGESEDLIKRESPAPHSMLVHPSARISDHKEYAAAIASWSADPELRQFASGGSPHLSPTGPELDPEGLTRRLEREEGSWFAWFERFERSRVALSGHFPGYARASLADRWEATKALLRDEIFSNVHIRLINSDEDADDRPGFDPERLGPDPGFAPARDLCSIFVAGSVMSRGVTLEGLTTTLFTRASGSPAADTQMQMQRWFGYRGKHLHWCRVFTYPDQLQLFREYHEYDEALRGEIIGRMNSGDWGDLTVLEGKSFRATGKIASVSKLPLHPGPAPFVRIKGSERNRVHNARVLSGLLASGEWTHITTSGTERGLILRHPVGMLRIAELLEALEFDEHRPDPKHPHYARWASREVDIDLPADARPFFRPPFREGPYYEGTSPGICPYSIAAYFRLWHAALSHGARGLFPTDDHGTPWALINRVKYAHDEPQFSIGIRFGSAGPTSLDSLKEYGIRAVIRRSTGNILDATWGSRGRAGGTDSYLGDQYFDYHLTGLTPPGQAAEEAAWRPRGHNGLLLFHVVRSEPVDAVVPALSIPIGGPDQFAAIAPEFSVA